MATHRPDTADRELHEHLEDRTGWRSIGWRWLIGIGILLLVVWFGRHVASEIKPMEEWIANHGVIGRCVFVGMTVLLTSMFVPDTLMAVAAGVMFGLFWGFLLTAAASMLTAAVDYFAASRLLRPRIERILAERPKMRAIQQAALREGLRLQILLRLAPISPVTVHYVLGAAGVRFPTFMLATVALFPALFVEVYFGNVASHVTKLAGGAGEHSRLHMAVTVAGFIACIALMTYVSRIVSKALAEAELQPSAAN